MTYCMRRVLSTIQMRLETVLRAEEGQGLVEYALILAFISILAIAALTFLSGDINSILTRIGTEL
jgi:Flp pilus assembly pilin Flp